MKESARGLVQSTGGSESAEAIQRIARSAEEAAPSLISVSKLALEINDSHPTSSDFNALAKLANAARQQAADLEAAVLDGSNSSSTVSGAATQEGSALGKAEKEALAKHEAAKELELLPCEQ